MEYLYYQLKIIQMISKNKKYSTPKGGGGDTGKKGERKSKLLTMLSRYSTKTRGSSGTNKNKKKN